MKVQKAKTVPNFDWLKEHMGIDEEDIIYTPEGDGEYVKFCGPGYEEVVAYSPDMIVVFDIEGEDRYEGVNIIINSDRVDP